MEEERWKGDRGFILILQKEKNLSMVMIVGYTLIRQLQQAHRKDLHRGPVLFISRFIMSVFMTPLLLKSLLICSLVLLYFYFRSACLRISLTPRQSQAAWPGDYPPLSHSCWTKSGGDSPNMFSTGRRSCVFLFLFCFLEPLIPRQGGGKSYLKSSKELQRSYNPLSLHPLEYLPFLKLVLQPPFKQIQRQVTASQSRSFHFFKDVQVLENIFFFFGTQSSTTYKKNPK